MSKLLTDELYNTPNYKSSRKPDHLPTQGAKLATDKEVSDVILL